MRLLAPIMAGAFMGYRILADAAGLSVTTASSGLLTINDTRWYGYLANVTPYEWESGLCNVVPEFIDGAAFMKWYSGTTDSVTHVDPSRTYAVRQPTAHPIYEHVCVQRFRELREHDTVGDNALMALGNLMYQSHASYSACGLGNLGTDRLVELVQAAGQVSDVYSAKITGGGSGGTVAILGRSEAEAAVYSIAEQYRAETGRDAIVLEGSSPGAVQAGLSQLRANS